MNARDALTDKELLLKKTARRRLVGAIALVVLMMMILPFVLKDRLIETAQKSVNITVVDQQQAQQPMLELPEDEATIEEGNSSTPAEPSSTKAPAPTAGEKSVSPSPEVAEKPEASVQEKASKVAEVMPAKTEPKVVAPKVVTQEKKPQPDKQSVKYYVQFGVFSEPKNLESLKTKLTQAGFDVISEKVDASGQKMRLRSSGYASKAEAVAALKKMQSVGFSGIVAGKP